MKIWNSQKKNKKRIITTGGGKQFHTILFYSAHILLLFFSLTNSRAAEIGVGIYYNSVTQQSEIRTLNPSTGTTSDVATLKRRIILFML